MVNAWKWAQSMVISMPQNIGKAKTKRFSDFAEEDRPLDGNKLKIDDILNREIEITAYRISESKFTDRKHGKCLSVQFNIEGTVRIFFTGSEILVRQIEKYKEHIPFLATVRKYHKYYTLT